MIEYRSVPLVKTLCDALEREINNRIRSQGVTYSQIRLLLRLSESDGGELPLKALEECLGVSQATIAGLIKRLESKRFLQIRADVEDKRVKRAAITPLGLEKCAEAHAHMDAIERKLTDGLTDIEAQLLHTLLRRACDNFK